MKNVIVKTGLGLFIYSMLVMAVSIKDPVKWEFTAVRSGMEATLEFKATIASPWHLYSTVTPEGGPVPTEFRFDDNKSFRLIGKIAEPSPVSKYDSGFDLQVKYFSNSVVFSQKIKLTDKSPAEVTGTVTYMVCDDEKCLPPNDVKFKISVPAAQ